MGKTFIASALEISHRHPLSEFLFLCNRKLYPRLLSSVLPYYIVNEFPKSGGTWLATLLSDALSVEFPRHQKLRLRSAIVHGHFHSPTGLRNVLVLWRDPRDVYISFYYHCYFTNEHGNRRLVETMKSVLPFDDYGDVRANLPAFIRLMNERPVTPSFTWSEFALVWVDRPGVCHARYENLRRDGPAELCRIVRELSGRRLAEAEAEAICERRSFARAKAEAEASASQRGGVELSFVREGSTGGWRRHFCDEALALTERYCGSMMTRLGYA